MTATQLFLAVAASLGVVGVAVGAFGAHALSARLPQERLQHVETAVRYLFFSIPGLILAGLLASAGGTRWWSDTQVVSGGSGAALVAGWAFIVGILLFSGSLLALALTGTRRWGAVTPFGGVGMVIGWAALVVAVLAG